MPKKIALLGSTGSIGEQSLDVISKTKDEVVALAAGRNIDKLEQQIRAYKPQWVAVADDDAAQVLKQRMEDIIPKVKILQGADSARKIVEECSADMVINAIVGIAGLGATLTALEGGMDVALANKESLVAGGNLVINAQKKTGAKLLPVDSEHSAIFQCLQDEHSAKTLKKIYLTASGGPFYGKKADQLLHVTKKEALKHPNWVMGQKITIDSASMMNKGLEFIEAMWLFSLPPQQIEIVVQRQSVIHSMVQFVDNSVLAQLGTPDMRLPIQYALTWPQRIECPAPELDFTTITQLDFGMPDEETFRCLRAARIAAEKGGLAPCAANGANEEAVDLFLKDKIKFLDIGRLVEGCVLSESYAGEYTLQDVYECDEKARRYVRENA